MKTLIAVIVVIAIIGAILWILGGLIKKMAEYDDLEID